MNTTPETPKNRRDEERDAHMRKKRGYEKQWGRGPQNENIGEQIIRVLMEHWWLSHPSPTNREMAHLLYLIMGQIPIEYLKAPAFVYNVEASKEFAGSMRAIIGNKE